MPIHKNATRTIEKAGAAALIAAAVGLFIAGFVGETGFFEKNTRTDTAARVADVSAGVALPAMPWRSVGGCGAGGSGGGGGGIKWIGEGVHGGLKDMQLKTMIKIDNGQNFQNHTLENRFSFKPRYSTTVGLTLPYVSKHGSVQPTTLVPEKYHRSGGTGDLTLDVSQALGMTGLYSFAFSLTMPTGQYDIKRGDDKTTKILPKGMQKGGGIYNVSLSLSRTIDTDDGMWMLDASFSHGFNMKPVSGENEFMDEYFADYTHYQDSSDDVEAKEHFYYRFKPYGENDLGDYTPPSVSASVYFADRSHENFMQSGGLSFSFPLDVAKIHSEDYNGVNTRYQPRYDPDHQAWSLTFSYGIEFKNGDFPVFLGASCPLHDKANAPEKDEDVQLWKLWNTPDLQDFPQQLTIAAGMKVAFFK